MVAEGLSREQQLLLDEFIAWDNTSQHQRVMLNAPQSITEWCKLKGINERTFRRLRSHPSYDERLAIWQKRQPGGTVDVSAALLTAAALPQQPARLPVLAPSELAALEAGALSDDDAYLTIKEKVIAGASTGDAKFLDLYFRTYGKAFVEEEVAARSHDLLNADLDTLVAEALAVVDTATLASALAARGWAVVPPGGEG